MDYGRYAIFVNPSKFESKINTEVLASQAILEGDLLRKKLKNRRILEITNVEQNRTTRNY